MGKKADLRAEINRLWELNGRLQAENDQLKRELGLVEGQLSDATKKLAAGIGKNRTGAYLPPEDEARRIAEGVGLVK